MITLEQAKRLKKGTVLYHTQNTNKDGTPQRWKVSGVPKTWKRTPGRVEVPLAHGLYNHAHLTEKDLDLVSLTDEDSVLRIERG